MASSDCLIQTKYSFLTKSSATVATISPSVCPSMNQMTPSLGEISPIPGPSTFQYTLISPNVPPVRVTVRVTGVPPSCSSTTLARESELKEKMPKASSLGRMLIAIVPPMSRPGVPISVERIRALKVRSSLVYYMHGYNYNF